jgi:hypothetical protein
MKWEECNFLESGDYETGIIKKGSKPFTLCMLKNNSFIGNKVCSKEKCILLNIVNGI